MSKRRSFILFVFSLGIAAAATYLANNWILKQIQSPKPEAQVLGVITASKYIAPDQRIALEHLVAKQMPKELIPSGAVRDVHQIVGKFATQEFYPDEVLFESRFKDDLEEGGFKTPEFKDILPTADKLIVAIEVDSVVGMGTFLRPGSRVDIMAARDDSLHGGLSQRRETGASRVSTNGQAYAAIETIVQDVKVLSVDQASAPEDGSPLMKVRAVTLEVSPYQAQILAGAEEWRLIVTLRPVQS